MKHLVHAGIYSITHLDSGRRYVGSAKNVSRRLSVHRANLRGGKHFCRYLQNAWNKYGESAFRFEAIEACLNSQVILLAREQHWLDHFEGYLFNSRLIAESTEGCKLDLSPEDRANRRRLAIDNFKRCPRPKQSNASLSREDIPAIFARYAKGETLVSLVAHYRVWKTTIIDVLHRRTWDEVPVAPEVIDACGKRLGHMGRKLTDDQVRTIKNRLASGDSLASIGRDFGISGTAVGFIRDGKNYAHVA